MRYLLKIVSFFFIFLTFNAWGAPTLLPKVLPQEQAFILNVSHEGSELELSWYISPECYLYQKQLQVTLINAKGEGFSILPILLPEAEITTDPYFGKQRIYRDRLSFDIDLASYLKQKRQIFHLKIDYQGCAESGFCYPPTTKWVMLNTQNEYIATARMLESPPKFAKKIVSEKPTNDYLSFAIIIGSFFLIGILLSFTPCVFPMIPIMFAVIVGEKHLNTRKAFWLSLCYALSMALTYAIAGVVAGLLGKNLQTSLQNPIPITLFALLFIYLGLLQIGAFRFRLHHSLQLKEILSHLHAKQESGTYIGASIMGILAALISSPCITPAFISALGIITKTGNTTLGASAFLAMGLGMGSILILIGTVGGKYMPKSGPWMKTINHIFALTMFGLSLWLLSRFIPGPLLLSLWALLCLYGAWLLKPVAVLLVLYAFLLFWGAMQGQSDPLKPLKSNPWQSLQPVATIPFEKVYSLLELEKAKALAQKENKPAMVAFHADWCTSCKSLENKLFHSVKLEGYLKNWIIIEADITNNDDQSLQMLKNYDIYGPPVILFFDASGNELEDQRIIGDLSEDELIRAFQSIDIKLGLSHNNPNLRRTAQ